MEIFSHQMCKKFPVLPPLTEFYCTIVIKNPSFFSHLLTFSRLFHRLRVAPNMLQTVEFTLFFIKQVNQQVAEV